MSEVKVVMPRRREPNQDNPYLTDEDIEWNACLDEVARLNAAPVQQVSVPDVSAMARILADRNADACNVNREDNWAIYGQDYIDDVTAMLADAPAAPAADAGLVEGECSDCNGSEWQALPDEEGVLRDVKCHCAALAAPGGE